MGKQTDEDIPFIGPLTIAKLSDDTLRKVAQGLGDLLEWIEQEPEEEWHRLGGLNQDKEYFFWIDKILQHSEEVGKNGKMRIRFNDVDTLRVELLRRGHTVEEFPGLEHYVGDSENE